MVGFLKGDYVKFRKVEKIQGNFEDIYKGIWYEITDVEKDGFYVMSNIRGEFFITEKELKFVKKIKRKLVKKNDKK